MSDTSYLLTLSCPNRPVSSLANCRTFSHGEHPRAHQFDDTETDAFHTHRLQSPGRSGDSETCRRFQADRRPLSMTWRSARNQRRKVLLLVSKLDHCLVDLLYRWRIASSGWMWSASVQSSTRDYNGTDFARYPSLLPITRRPSRSRKHRSRLSSGNCADLCARRYMQSCLTISHPFCRSLHNIHHSFLPASRREPYHQLMRAA